MTDVVSIFRSYIFKIVSQPSLEGMKAMLYDEECKNMIAITCSLTELISKDVVLVGQLVAGKEKNASGTSIAVPSDDLKADRASTSHLKCVMVLRPVLESIEAVCQQLRRPLFSSYFIFFTNEPSDEYLKMLAKADVHELVRQVHIYYSDFYAYEPTLYIANTYKTILSNITTTWSSTVMHEVHRNIDALTAFLLSVRNMPPVRTSNSKAAKAFAAELAQRVNNQRDTFQFPSQNPNTLLLILDRKDDPITPLATSWAYVALIHELFPTNNLRVDLRGVPDIKPDMTEVVLSTKFDDYFAKHMYSPYADVAASFSSLVQEYNKQKQLSSNLNTIEDFRKVVDKLPQLTALGGNITKHATILTEIKRQIESYNLIDISKLEQEIICDNAHSKHVAALETMLNSQNLRFDNKLNLLLLYAIKYETEQHNRINEFKTLLERLYPSPDHLHRIAGVDQLLYLCGTKQRSTNLTHGRSVLDKMTSFVASSIRDVENVFNRHKPLVLDIIERFLNKQAKPPSYPLHPMLNNTTDLTSKEIIPCPEVLYIYIVGGVTFAEASFIDTWNKNNTQGLKVVLGGSCIHTSRSFMDDIQSKSSKPNNTQHAIDFS